MKIYSYHTKILKGDHDRDVYCLLNLYTYDILKQVVELIGLTSNGRIINILRSDTVLLAENEQELQALKDQVYISRPKWGSDINKAITTKISNEMETVIMNFTVNGEQISRIWANNNRRNVVVKQK